MGEQSQKTANSLGAGVSRQQQPISHKITASHELAIMQHIRADQLEEMERTYTYLLEAIKEARRTKQAAEKQQAISIKYGKQNAIIHRRRCLKINWLWKHGKTSKEIDTIMTDKRGYCVNRMCASEGSDIKRKLIQDAKKRFVIAAVVAGIGIRPTARAVPPALGTCSPALVSKIMKAEKIRNQVPLAFPLQSV